MNRKNCEPRYIQVKKVSNVHLWHFARTMIFISQVDLTETVTLQLRQLMYQFNAFRLLQLYTKIRIATASEYSEANDRNVRQNWSGQDHTNNRTSMRKNKKIQSTRWLKSNFQIQQILSFQRTLVFYDSCRFNKDKFSWKNGEWRVRVKRARLLFLFFLLFSVLLFFFFYFRILYQLARSLRTMR